MQTVPACFERYAALFVDMKIKYILILLTISLVTLTSFGQSKFVGEFKRLYELADSAVEKPVENMYNKKIIIRSDYTYSYSEQENPNAFDKPLKESIEGSWKSNCDTIEFYNKNYKIPKGVIFNYIENQNFNGIKVILKNRKGKPLEIKWCSVDSLSPDGKTTHTNIPYRKSSKNSVMINDSCYTAIFVRPKNYCSDFIRCYLEIYLNKVKSGTLIEITCYSKEIEMIFNKKKYILTRNILHEKSTSRIMPDAWTDNYIKIK